MLSALKEGVTKKNIKRKIRPKRILCGGAGVAKRATSSKRAGHLEVVVVQYLRRFESCPPHIYF